jgi:hypothetical protein
MAIVTVFNGPSPTTAAQVAVTTGTAIKTMLQFEPSATLAVRLKGYGISFDGSAAATPIKVECLETDVAATVTAYAAADLNKIDGDAIACGNLSTNVIQIGTSNSGYTSSGEGSITVVRMFDAAFVAPTNQYIYEWPPDDMPLLQVSKFTRIRVTAGAAVNCYCWLRLKI